MARKRYFGYFAVKKANGKLTNSFAFGDFKFISSAVESWATDSKKSPPKEDIDPPLGPDFTHESALTSALSRAVDFALSQFHLILVTSLTPTYFYRSLCKEHVINPIISDSTAVSQHESGDIYGLSEDQYYSAIKRREYLDQMRSGVENLPSATLMSIVSTFDTLIADVVAKMLRLDKSWLQKSQRNLPFSRLSEASSLEELIEEAVSEELYQFLRGSHDEQAKYIETTFGVGIKGMLAYARAPVTKDPKKYWERT